MGAFEHLALVAVADLFVCLCIGVFVPLICLFVHFLHFALCAIEPLALVAFARLFVYLCVGGPGAEPPENFGVYFEN